MLKSVFLSGAALAAFTHSAAAQSQNSLLVPPENVVVTATRIATPIDQVASSITVIDAADIDARQQRSLPDVLRDVPGLNLVQAGGEGGQASIFMRGSNSNHTKVLVDGIEDSDPSKPNGAYDFGKFNSADIARVEVLRGPQSGLYGSDAIGGVINVITKSGNGPLTASVTAEGGSFDTFNQSATVSGSEDAFHYRASLAHLHAGATPVTPLDLLPPGQKRNDDFFDNVTASAKLGYDLSDRLDLGLVGRYSNSLSKVTGDAFDPATFASFPSPLQTRIDTLSYNARATAHLVLGSIDQTVGLGYSSTVTSDMDPDNGPIPSSGDRIKLDWQGQIAIADGQTVVLGAETTRDAIHVPLSAGITTNAGYGELQSSFPDLIDGVDFHNSISIRHDSNSRFGDRTTWHVAPVLAITGTDTRLHASYGSGFKAPSLVQLFEDFPAFFFFANPNLKPETSTGYDVGADWTPFDGFTAGATWFRNDIRNLIATDPVTFSTDINIGKARTQGVELFAAWAATQTLNLRADYTYTDAIDGTTGLELLRRPRNKASLNAAWRFLPQAGLDATLLYVGPWIDGSRDFSVPRLKTDGYVTMDLAAHYDLDARFTLFARASNLFDETYENPVGFLGPERAFYAGVQAKL